MTAKQFSLYILPKQVKSSCVRARKLKHTSDVWGEVEVGTFPKNLHDNS